MKIKRKILTLLLSATMIVTFLPVAVCADEEAVPENGETVAAEEALDEEEIPASEQDSVAAAEEAQADAGEPVSAEYVGAPLRGVINTSRVLSLEDPTEGANEFVVTFGDGSKKTFGWTVSDRFPEGAFAYDENTYLFAKVLEDEEAPVSFINGLNNDVEFHLRVFYNVGGEEKEKDLTAVTDVICAYDHKPIAIRFEAADGFTPECNAGPNYLTEEIFFGEGNEFVLTCEGWDAGEGKYTTYNNHYKYTETENENGEKVGVFALNGNPERYGVFNLDEGVYCNLDLGNEGPAQFSYTEFVNELDEYVTVSFSVPVKATKIEPYVFWQVFTYTGKTITPEFKVYDYMDNLIDPSEYTVAAEDAKNMGWYEATITFKNKEKYVDSITAYYGVGPAAPKITKLVSGKKKLTVKWKKMSAKQLKAIDGFYIELSTDSDFIDIVKTVKVSKKAFKSKKKTIKGLKKGKTYYVRMYSYKNIKVDGEKEMMSSENSNVLHKKAK